MQSEPVLDFSLNAERSETPAEAGTVAHPFFKATARYEIYQRPAGDEAATAQTIELMRTVAAADSQTKLISAVAAMATAGARTEREALAGIFRFVKNRIQFREDKETAAPLAGVLDPEDAEVLIRPFDLLTMRDPAGDCDDFAMLTAALMLAAGIEPAFRTIAADPEQEEYSHVYAVAMQPGGIYIAMDTSHGTAPGWEYPPSGKSKLWRVFHPMLKPAKVGALPTWAIDLIKTGAETGSAIAKTRYAQPPAGTYTQGADGSVFYRQAPGASALTFPGVNVGGAGGSTLLLLGVGLVGVMVLAQAFRR